MQSNCLCVILPDERKNSLILTVAKKRMAVLVYTALTWLATLSSPSLGKNGWLRPRASKFVLLSVFSLSKTI